MQETIETLPRVVETIAQGRIAKSPVHGHGLFARQDVASGQTLCWLDGQLVPMDVLRAAGEDLQAEWNALPQGMVLLRALRTSYFFINHSRGPNLKVCGHGSGKLFVVSTRDIGRGQEFFLDYRDEPLDQAYLAGHGASYL